MTADVARIEPCAWCGGPYRANALGRPRRYCSVTCRATAGRYRASLPGWRDRLAQLERDAAGYPRVPTLIRNEMAELRRAIAAGPYIDRSAEP